MSEREGAPVPLVAIGTIRTPFATKEQAPIQGAFHPENEGTVELYPQFADGLADIDGFSHLILLYAFDRAGEVAMRRATFLSDEEHGLWSTRHPARPNRIGLQPNRCRRNRDDEFMTLSFHQRTDGFHGSLNHYR